jgi:hypothetical protein
MLRVPGEPKIDLPALAEDGYLPMRDLRLALRQLRKAPGFSLAIVLTLALGIGATTAIFSLVEGVLLRPLPFRDPQRLVLLGDRLGDGPQLGVTASEVATYEHAAQAFSSIGAWDNTSWESSPPRPPAASLPDCLLYLSLCTSRDWSHKRNRRQHRTVDLFRLRKR